MTVATKTRADFAINPLHPGFAAEILPGEGLPAFAKAPLRA